MGDRPKDASKEEIEQLRAKVAELKKALSDVEERNTRLVSAGLEVPMKRSEERDKAVAERDQAIERRDGAVAELSEFKNYADPLLAEHDHIQAKLRHISTETEGLILRLERIGTAFRGSDNRHRARRAIEAVMATITFLNRHGVESRLLVPLKDLYSALSDAERGISNPTTTAPDESKRRSKGAPMRANESNHWGSASWAVTGLIRLGDIKKKALDIAAEAAGLPRDKLMKFRQGLIAPNRRGPIGAQYVYDYLDEDVARDSRFELKIIVERLLSRLRETRDIGLI